MKIGCTYKTVTKKLNGKAERKARDLQQALSGSSNSFKVPKVSVYYESDELKYISFEYSEYEEDKYKNGVHRLKAQIADDN